MPYDPFGGNQGPGGNIQETPVLSPQELADEAERMRKIEEASRNIQAGLNPDGSPRSPEWDELGSILDEEGNVQEQYELDPEGIAGYDQFKEFATGTGPSPWALAQQEATGLRTQEQRDEATRTAAGETAQARPTMQARQALPR